MESFFLKKKLKVQIVASSTAPNVPSMKLSQLNAELGHFGLKIWTQNPGTERSSNSVLAQREGYDLVTTRNEAQLKIQRIAENE